MKLAALILPLAATLLLQGCASELDTSVERSSEADDGQSAVTEPVSGIDKEALAAIIGLGSQVGVFYYPDKIDRRQLSAAPVKLCEARGAKVVEVEDTDLRHPEEWPGARHLVVRCSR